MKKIALIFLLGFLPFTISGIIAQNQTTKPRVLPNFTPKVPQEGVSLAVQRVSQKKAACFVDGTIEKKNYKIVDYTTSVSVNLEYNILFRLVNPCNDKIEKLWIQYTETQDGEYVCTKDTFYESRY